MRDHLRSTINLKFPANFFKNYAKGKTCLIRVAVACGYACDDDDTTVLCHPSIAGLKAMGSRGASVPDIGGAHGCHTCHALCDGRYEARPGSPAFAMGPGVRKQFLQNALLEGVIRTIDRLVKDGVLPNP